MNSESSSPARDPSLSVGEVWKVYGTKLGTQRNARVGKSTEDKGKNYCGRRVHMAITPHWDVAPLNSEGNSAELRYTSMPSNW